MEKEAAARAEEDTFIQPAHTPTRDCARHQPYTTQAGGLWRLWPPKAACLLSLYPFPFPHRDSLTILTKVCFV